MAKVKQIAFDEEMEVLDPIQSKYVYELLTQNEEQENHVFDGNSGRPLKGKKFRPFQTLLLRSAIVLTKDQIEEDAKKPKEERLFDGRKPGKYFIEYYDGCTNLFSDTHPEEKELDLLRRQTHRDNKVFNHGSLEVYGFDTMFKLYLDMASWNEASPYRVRTVDALYRPVDSENVADRDTADLDKLEEALELARKATIKKMRIHGRFLGVSEVDVRTGNPVTPKAMRAEYRKAAVANPKEFIKTYNDKSLELKEWIKAGMEKGEIDTNIIPNQAVWKSKGAPICDISGLTSKEGILNKLIEFAKSEDGQVFVEQLKALYN